MLTVASVDLIFPSVFENEREGVNIPGPVCIG